MSREHDERAIKGVSTGLLGKVVHGILNGHERVEIRDTDYAVTVVAYRVPPNLIRIDIKP